MAAVNKITDKVTKLSHRIFNTSVTETKVVRDGNPFSKSNFQKNILMEDVFQSSTAKATLGINDKISAGTKRVYSTFVGSITDFGNRILGGVESIKTFCSKVKGGVINAWNKAAEIANTEIRFDGLKANLNEVKEVMSKDITSFFKSGAGREITKMSKMDPHTEIKPAFTEALSALEADLAAAA